MRCVFGECIQLYVGQDTYNLLKWSINNRERVTLETKSRGYYIARLTEITFSSQLWSCMNSSCILTHFQWYLVYIFAAMYCRTLCLQRIQFIRWGIGLCADNALFVGILWESVGVLFLRYLSLVANYCLLLAPVLPLHRQIVLAFLPLFRRDKVR